MKSSLRQPGCNSLRLDSESGASQMPAVLSQFPKSYSILPDKTKKYNPYIGGICWNIFPKGTQFFRFDFVVSLPQSWKFSYGSLQYPTNPSSPENGNLGEKIVHPNIFWQDEPGSLGIGGVPVYLLIANISYLNMNGWKCMKFWYIILYLYIVHIDILPFWFRKGF